ncbi:MAG TPA: SDR family NAD(P)-dependent oxidoreductase, partial [Rhizomicrobium sp.]
MAAQSVLIVGVGAREGLGAALAKRFAGGGFSVTIAGRNAAKLEATAKALGGEVEAVAGDAADPADVARFVAAANRRA